MRPNTVMSLSLSTNTPTTTTLTPTTFKKITQLFESDGCLDNLQNFEDTSSGGFIPPSVTPASILNLSMDDSNTNNKAKKTYTSLENTKLTWQGGVTQIVTPSKQVQPFIVLASDEDQENQEYNMMLAPATIPTQVEELKPRKSNRLARSNTMEMVKELLAANEDNDSDYNPEEEQQVQPKKKATARGKSAASRKRTSNGGRKSAAKQEEMDEDLDPEEFGRLTVRRQRNKEAAARCRKRRVDLTDKLQDEVDAHASKRRALEEEIKTLKAQKEDLEFILQSHSHSCKISGTFQMPAPQVAIPLYVQQQHQHQQQPQVQQQQQVFIAVKSEPSPAPVIVEPVNAPYMIPEQVMLPQSIECDLSMTAVAVEEEEPKPKRPAFLSLKTKRVPTQSEAKTGVTIDTPSTVIMHSFGFDSVTTGLTPSCPSLPSLVTSIVTPTLNTPTTCSSQQRSSDLHFDVTTPDYVAL